MFNFLKKNYLGAMLNGEVVAVYADENLVVHPKHRRKGIGTKLFKKMRGVDNSEIEVTTWDGVYFLDKMFSTFVVHGGFLENIDDELSIKYIERYKDQINTFIDVTNYKEEI